jgi:hypothetical protein
MIRSRGALIVLVGTSLAIACRAARSPVDAGFDSCTDPRITPSSRLLLEPSSGISSGSRLTSSDDASRVLANAQPFQGGYAGVARLASDGGAIDPSIRAFIGATDFSRDDLVFTTALFYDPGPPLVGQALVDGKFLVVTHDCGGGGGGMARSQQSWIAAYRVPKNVQLVETGCGECPPPPPCCPP